MWVLFLLPFIFVFLDGWYFIRAFWIGFIANYKMRYSKNHALGLNEDDLYKTYRTKGIVLPSDLDVNLHMNNSKYCRECDFGRVYFYQVSGMRQALSQHKAWIVVNAISVRYRRPLHLFQFFEISTHMLCFDDNAVYLEQKMLLPNGFVAAVLLIKMAVRGASCGDIFSTMCGGKKVSSRPPLPELRKWQESISLSSERLRNK